MCEVGTVGDISDYQPEGPRFSPRLAQGLNFGQPSFATPSVDMDVKPLVCSLNLGCIRLTLFHLFQNKNNLLKVMTGVRDITRLCCSPNLAGIVTSKIEQSFYSAYSYSGIESIEHAFTIGGLRTHALDLVNKSRLMPVLWTMYVHLIINTFNETCTIKIILFY